ncbi:MAG: hypothetical protein Q9160_001117 [Pyrenula sp. 1 TL-2023]
MASVTSTALTKRPSSDLMGPPPPPKRIKRPPKVLDEDDYTEALSQIIARDFFPGLAETKTQKEYLDALESNDPVWIATAGKNLQEAMTPRPGGRGAATRLKRDSTPAFTSLAGDQTPRGWQGATPASVAGTDQLDLESEPQKLEIDTTSLSLSAFQAKYTSEDNESFNALLDQQNIKRREKYTFLWNDNKIPAPRQIAHRAREAKLLKDKEEDNSGTTSNALALTTGATSSRPARPEAWTSKPNNSLMFQPPSIDDDGLETVAKRAQAESRAPPKQTLYHNTRLPLPPQHQSPYNQAPPPSPSLSAISSAIAGHPRGLPSSSAAPSTISGSETPRINGYSFVDDDEPEPPPPSSAENSGPSYRDLLAGQTPASSPSPFSIAENRKRESLHHRMVEKTNRSNRKKRLDTVSVNTNTPTPAVPRFLSSPFVGIGGGRTPAGGGLGSGGGKRAGGMMTPAAKRLLERVGGGGGGGGGKTPRAETDAAGGGDAGSGSGSGGGSGSGLKKMWTPKPTPRRKG